jgi:hypothetical protein
VKKSVITVVIVCISLLITAFLFFINDVVITIRLNELRENLLEHNRSEGSMDHIGLIATYQINKSIYENKISQEDADSIESNIMLLVKSEGRDNPAVAPVKYKLISQPTIQLINFNRMIIGKSPLTYHLSPEKNLADLDMAYYFERNFLFKRAIELYVKALENIYMDNALRASILLHQGYCYALAGLNDRATFNYNTIINKYGNENSAITASVLLTYLEGFKLARERVLKSKDNPLSRSQDLVALLSYEQALKILDEEEHKAGPGDIPRIKYFKARCFTGLGEPEKAAENYLDVIASSPASLFAKYSNRKLFIMGERAGGENEIIKIAKQLNKKLNDPVLTEMIQKKEENPEPDINLQKIEKINISKTILEKFDKITENNEKPEKVEKYLTIITSDGNTFKGTLIEQNDMEISLQTSIGRINVKKDKITSINAK